MGLEALRAAVEQDATVDNLRALRTGLEAELRALHETIGDADPTADQQTRWTELDDEHQRTVERITAEERAARVRDSRRRFGDVQFGQRVDPFDGSDVQRLSRDEIRDRSLKALDSRDLSEHLSDDQKVRLERMLRNRTRNSDGTAIGRRLLVTETPEYRSAFQKLVSSPTPILTPDEGRAVQAFLEYREMNIGTDADGGYGVPVLIDPTIILTAQGHPNDFFAISRVETITNDSWRGVSSAGVSWSFDAESAEVSDDSPTLAQPAVPVHKAQGYIPYSIEVGMDYPGFAGEMSTLLAEGYSELLVDRFTVGTGVNQPTGIITALDGTASELDLTVTDTFDADEVNRLWAALPPRYRQGASWMSHTTINNLVQQFGSGDNDAAFTVDFTAEGVTVLKGRRYYLNDYMNGNFGGNVAPFLVVGDFRNYLIAQRAGMSIELVPHVFATGNNRPSGERAWYAWARVGADSINDSAFRVLSDNGA